MASGWDQKSLLYQLSYRPQPAPLSQRRLRGCGAMVLARPARQARVEAARVSP